MESISVADLIVKGLIWDRSVVFKFVNQFGHYMNVTSDNIVTFLNMLNQAELNEFFVRF